MVKNINCLECANCCRELKIGVSREDIRRIGNELVITEREVIEKYTEPDESGELLLKGNPCIFLKGNECAIY